MTISNDRSLTGDSLFGMELRHLRYFCAVAEQRSFTQAARRLHVSQSGVSGQVRDLEKEIGVKLLRRSQREVSLTAEGEVFLREARDILFRSERAIEMTVRASRGQFGKLSIGLCGPATAPFLPHFIRSFRKRQPGVDLALKEIDPAHQAQGLVDGQIDVGFTRGLPPEFRSTLSSELLFSEPILAVLPKGHPLADQPALHVAQLAQERFVFYSRDCAPDLFDTMIALCKKARFSPKIVDSPNIWQSVLTMVEAAEGVALVPACVQQLRYSGVSFHRLHRGWEVDVILAWVRNRPDALRDGFLDLLRKNRPEIERSMRRS